MPKLACNSRLKNLGSYAKKQHHNTLGNHNSSPLADSLGRNRVSDLEEGNNSGSIHLTEEHVVDQTESPDFSDLSEADDVPEGKDPSLIAAWLQASSDQLSRLVQFNLPTLKVRGPYAKSRLHGVPAPRTQRNHHAIARKARAAHGGGLVQFFKPIGSSHGASSGPVDLTLDSSDSDREIISGPEAPPTSASLHVPRDNLNLLSIDVQELEEDFEDQIPNEIYVENTTPTASLSTSPPASLPPSHSTETSGPAWLRSYPAARACSLPPTPSAVNAAIKQIADILHPCRDTGNGYKCAKLDPVLQACLELMSSLLCLYVEGQPGTVDVAHTIAANRLSDNSVYSRTVMLLLCTVNYKGSVVLGTL
ncbi:hypothetical protein GGU11DRAFT_751322 [Lentinula aff. detonsa]|nr:hypothetical protein GGU11DRAFT_751322 [Lentinula aff. detonsa]